MVSAYERLELLRNVGHHLAFQRDVHFVAVVTELHVPQSRSGRIFALEKLGNGDLVAEGGIVVDD